MKKIVIMCMTTYCYVICMNNATSVALYNNGQSIPISNIPVFQGFNHGRGSIITSKSSIPQVHNRRKRRTQGQRKKVLTIEDKIQVINNKIDKHIVGVENNGCCNAIKLFFRQGFYRHNIRNTFESEIIHELQKIDVYIQKENDSIQKQDQKIIPLLAEKNIIFKSLIVRLVRFYYDDCSYQLEGLRDGVDCRDKMKGSKIDGLYGETNMFPMFSSYLNQYIGKEIKKLFYQYYVSSVDRVQVQLHHEIKQVSYFNLINFFKFNKIDAAIYSIALIGHSNIIDKTSIEKSFDERYIRAKDLSGKMIIWDTTTGKHYNNINHAITWLKKELYEDKFYNLENVIRFYDHDNESYHISLITCNKLFNLPGICIQEEIPMNLYLYAKPTFESWLCQKVFEKSMDNNTELDALLQSDMLKSLKGFVKDNFKRAIRAAKEANNNEYCLL